MHKAKVMTIVIVSNGCTWGGLRNPEEVRVPLSPSLPLFLSQPPPPPPPIRCEHHHHQQQQGVSIVRAGCSIVNNEFMVVVDSRGLSKKQPLLRLNGHIIKIGTRSHTHISHHTHTHHITHTHHTTHTHGRSTHTDITSHHTHTHHITSYTHHITSHTHHITHTHHRFHEAYRESQSAQNPPQPIIYTSEEVYEWFLIEMGPTIERTPFGSFSLSLFQLFRSFTRRVGSLFISLNVNHHSTHHTAQA